MGEFLYSCFFLSLSSFGIRVFSSSADAGIAAPKRQRGRPPVRTLLLAQPHITSLSSLAVAKVEGLRATEYRTRPVRPVEERSALRDLASVVLASYLGRSKTQKRNTRRLYIRTLAWPFLSVSLLRPVLSVDLLEDLSNFIRAFARTDRTSEYLAARILLKVTAWLVLYVFFCV